jgi:flagellar M-ring protein FliF
MKAIIDGLTALGMARLVALGGVGLAVLALVGLMALRGTGSSGHMALLYGELDTREAAQMADALDHAHIEHQESAAGDRVMVPVAEVARARMLLAKDGLPTGGSIGYEIFDRGDAMTASDFQQQINETRAMEGEIARSIRMLHGVRAARVHLVLPRRQPFSQDVQPAQASIMLTMAGAERLDAQGVQAVLNLVAAAVPGLKPQAIAVVDSRGNVLARAGQPASDEALLQSNEDLRRATEAKLSRAIEDMLDQSLGPGHARAEAAVEMNFEHVHETTENYNPEQQVVRSTQTVTDTSKSSEGEKTVSVQNNLPNADAGAGGQNGSTEARNEETTNYEIGKTVRTMVREQPQIARISLAVMVDGVTAPGPDGKPAWHERGADDIGRIKRLVQTAIGFDTKRGDSVEVVSMKFTSPDDTATPPAGGLAALGIDKTDLISLAQSTILGVVVLLALFFVVRPMAMRLSVAGVAPDGTPLLGDPDSPQRGIGGRGAALAGAGSPALVTDESMVELSNVEGQMRASSLRKLVEMVEGHPEETLNIMRNWLAAERS